MNVERFNSLAIELHILRTQLENNFSDTKVAEKLFYLSNEISDEIWKEMENDSLLFKIYCEYLVEGYNI